MSVLPPEIRHAFQEGNFVVKRTYRRFNQVSADQSTEWLNAIGNKSVGLVGITRVASALSRWILSYNLRTVIASQRTAMLRLTTDDEDDEYTPNRCTQGRTESDDINEGHIVIVETARCVSRCRWHVDKYDQQRCGHTWDARIFA